MLDAALACAAPVELAEQERLWIAQHPVLRVGVMENLVPFEYMSNGVLQGRPVQYNMCAMPRGLNSPMCRSRPGLHVSACCWMAR